LYKICYMNKLALYVIWQLILPPYTFCHLIYNIVNSLYKIRKLSHLHINILLSIASIASLVTITNLCLFSNNLSDLCGKNRNTMSLTWVYSLQVSLWIGGLTPNYEHCLHPAFNMTVFCRHTLLIWRSVRPKAWSLSIWHTSIRHPDA
jgi:hypothetical protein